MNRYKHLLVPLFLISLVLVFTMAKSPGPDQSSKITPKRSQELIERVMELIRSNYIEEPNPNRTMEGAFRGLMGSLDLLSSYLDNVEMAKFNDPDKELLPDVGIVLFKRQGAFPLIFGIRDDSPARIEEVKVGDVVTALDGQSTHTLSMLEANLYLKSRDGGPVSFKVVRGDEDRVITLERRRPETRPFILLPGGEGDRLRINRFSSGMVETFKTEGLPGLKDRTAPLILDLRNNWEGAYLEARDFLDLFISRKELGSFQQRDQAEESWTALEPAPLEQLPLIIWTNRGTLGPAEIVAAVLQKEKSAKVVGTQTAGLTAMQRMIPLDDGTGLLLTTAVYSLPGGDLLWLKGVKPDIRIEEGDESPEAYFAASRTLNSNR